MDVVLVQTEHGLEGLGERAKRGYERWKQTVKSLQLGETIRFSWHEPRNPRMHGLHFAMLAKVFDAQEAFVDMEPFRLWVQVGAGHCDFVPGPKGKPVAIPRSIAFEKLDEGTFQEHHQAAKEFLRSVYATRVLWPLMSDLMADERVAALLAEFER
jgi:hypothetical protein